MSGIPPANQEPNKPRSKSPSGKPRGRSNNKKASVSPTPKVKASPGRKGAAAVEEVKGAAVVLSPEEVQARLYQKGYERMFKLELIKQ